MLERNDVSTLHNLITSHVAWTLTVEGEDGLGMVDCLMEAGRRFEVSRTNPAGFAVLPMIPDVISLGR